MTKRERAEQSRQHRDMELALLNIRDLISRGYIIEHSVVGAVLKNHVDAGLRWRGQ
jgi:hypothetical protein